MAVPSLLLHFWEARAVSSGQMSMCRGGTILPPVLCGPEKSLLMDEYFSRVPRRTFEG